MKSRRTMPIVSATLALTVAVALTAAKDDNHVNVIVNFGDPGALAGAANQVVIPNEVTIDKGGTVTFVVNGPGHGIAIYPVSDNTTRSTIPSTDCSRHLLRSVTFPVSFSQDRRRRPPGRNCSFGLPRQVAIWLSA